MTDHHQHTEQIRLWVSTHDNGWEAWVAQHDDGTFTAWACRATENAAAGLYIEDNLSFPYQGAQHATLTLRRHPRYGSDVILLIERGQFLCGIDECRVLVSFDGHPPESFSAGGPADHSTETLFIRNYTRFVERLHKAKEVRIAANLYQGGQPAFEFNVAGLDAGRLKSSTKSR